MASNSNEQQIYLKARQNKKDLIDLSGDNNETCGNNILDLFDPLSHNIEQDRGQKDQHKSCSNKPVLELKKRDRRVRDTSIISCSSKNEFASRTSQGRAAGLWRHSSCSSTISKSSTALALNSDSSSTSTENDVNKRINKLTLKSSSSSSIEDSLRSSKSNSDLSSALAGEVFKDDERGSRIRLTRKHQRSSREIVCLTNKIKSFRAKYKFDDKITNPGLVYSPTLYSSKGRDMSVKIVITSPLCSSPINFTCDVSTTIEHLISHAVCTIYDDFQEDTMENYLLKVTGKDEYFDSSLCLAAYALVSHCWKFDLDVPLTLIRAEDAKRSFLRTSKDDFRVKSLLCPDDLLSRTFILKYSDLNYEALSIIIETFEREANRLYQDVGSRSASLQTQSLLQTTKAICSKMMNCETGQLTESKDNLTQLCRSYKNEGDQLRDEDRYKMIEVIQHAIKRLVQNMHNLLRLTSKSLPVDYEVLNLIAANNLKISFVDTPINMVKDQLSLRVLVISQLKPEWLTKYNEFHLELQVKHGETPICSPVVTSTIRVDTSFFPRLLFDEELNFSLVYSSLPREARFVMILHGTEFVPVINHQSNQLHIPGDDSIPLRRSSSASSVCSTAPMYSSSPKGSQIEGAQKTLSEPVQTTLAVSMAYLFDEELNLRQGDKLLYMHPLVDAENEDIYIETVAARDDPIILVEFKKFPVEKKIYFPNEPQKRPAYETKNLDFDQLDSGRRFVLEQIINEKQFHETLMEDERALLWDNRLYLTSFQGALPKILLSVPSWSYSNLTDIYKTLDTCQPLEAIDALQLLLPSFPDSYIRSKAIEWISKQPDDELYDYLPQLVQAFRYEKSLDCSLFWLLLDRALRNVRIANLLYWQLKLNTRDKLFQERSETLINCLLHCCGAALWKSFDKQEELLSKLTQISSEIKKVRDSQRMGVLHKYLEMVQDYLMENKPSMPWAPSLEVCDLEVRSCSYFPSNTLPLRLAFRSCEKSCNNVVRFHTYDTIFKMGDDLRQDMLAMQMIRIMEKLWLREGLDLRMVTFDCLATNDRQGMVEMVQNAETLCKIQQNRSILAGAFKDNAIDNYIRLWNTSELEYKTALDTFLHSCAGYSVATYILGICDRHNDNIMVTNSGHLFHIDFGKFLGDAQMMGSIKRDRTPFVLTADMAYVINGGDRPSKKFQTFIELCTMGFNIIRRHRNLFLNLFSLMASAKIHGLNSESVKYVDKMLMPNLTETEAMAKFTRLIDECLSSKATQVNFFIHNLAQLRFSNNNSKQSLLSFVPKTFSMQTDGRIEYLDITHLYKKYEPEKQYYYVVLVKRQDQPDATYVTRTYREFSELQIKLTCMFPGYHFHDINKSTGSFLMDFVGRTNTREIAERRLIQLKTFLAKLLMLPPEIAQCDLIYTFFHPILRDQSTNSADVSISNESASTFGSQEYNETQRNALYLGSNGQVKLSMSYKNSSFIIMIMHAKNLPKLDGSALPNSYAKTYLLPDPHKQTKKNTRVVRQSCHPSFMEMLVYDIPLEALKSLTLQVSIWHSEIVQYKIFMGAALIPLDKVDLTKEVASWYPLRNF